MISQKHETSDFKKIKTANNEIILYKAPWLG